MFSPDSKEFVELLIKHKAEYLIVGGYSVGVHGHPRYTGDLDIWLNPTMENAKRVLNCIQEFRFGSFGLKEEDFTKEGNVIQLGYPPLRINLLSAIDGLQFKYCYKNKIQVDIEGLQVNFISYHDLIKNKKATGRPIDLDDIDNMKE